MTTGKDEFGHFIIFAIDGIRYQYDVDFPVMKKAQQIAEQSPGKALSFVKKNNYRWEKLKDV